MNTMNHAIWLKLQYLIHSDVKTAFCPVFIVYSYLIEYNVIYKKVLPYLHGKEFAPQKNVIQAI